MEDKVDTRRMLNLGCGNKILPPPWVNVDAYERGRVSPDIIADVRDLGIFNDAEADVVMAIHVIEHFYRWEVAEVLKEWIRILRPGGLLILECPNIVKAALFLLNGKPDQLSLWPFFGDPGHKDPAMCHRWGYTPSTLSALLSDAGLVNVRQEPAQFHMKDARDMRSVGEKPLE